MEGAGMRAKPASGPSRHYPMPIQFFHEVLFYFFQKFRNKIILFSIFLKHALRADETPGDSTYMISNREGEAPAEPQSQVRNNLPFAARQEPRPPVFDRLRPPFSAGCRGAVGLAKGSTYPTLPASRTIRARAMDEPWRFRALQV